MKKKIVPILLGNVIGFIMFWLLNLFLSNNQVGIFLIGLSIGTLLGVGIMSILQVGKE